MVGVLESATHSGAAARVQELVLGIGINVSQRPEDFTPEVRDLERIAEAAARWAVDPGAKVAVKIWAVEVLKHCRQRVGWVQEVWDDLVETMAHDATPGSEVRMRKSWKESSRP